MKKVICTLLALVLLTLAGCGGNAPGENQLCRLENDIFMDNCAGFTCYLGDGWEIKDADLPDLMKKLDKAPVVTALHASGEDGMDFIDVQYLSFQTYSNKNALMADSEEAFLDYFMTLDAAKGESSLEDGWEALPLEKVKVNFLGEEHWAGKRELQYQGVSMYKTVVWVFPEGLYGVGVTCTSLVEDRTQEKLDLFVPMGL